MSPAEYAVLVSANERLRAENGRLRASLQNIFAVRDEFDAAEGTPWYLFVDAIDKERDALKDK